MDDEGIVTGQLAEPFELLIGEELRQAVVSGAIAGTIAGPEIDGPWDLTAIDNGNLATLFLTNVLIGIKAPG